MKKYIHVIICSFLLIGFLLDSSLGYTQQCTPQQQFVFNNPSFEGPRQPHITPAPWNTCGLSPDTQPGSWGVNLAPSNGNSYIGLVQGGATWREGVSQQLSGNLQAGVTYTFTIDLAMGNSAQGGIVPAPTRIQIFGGNAACQMTQLLWTSPTVANTGWLTYTVTFTPNQNFGFIYIIIDNTAPMNSYMLIDNITPIVPQLPTIDITSHINGDVTACSFTLSGTLSMPLADSVILTGPFIGSPLHANVTGTTWSRNLQFNGPGTYTLYARVYYRDPVLNIDACSFDSVIVNVSAPSAAFSVPNHCLNGSVSLTDNSTGVGTTAIVGWNWTFGDGGSSSSQNPSHLYSSAGTYTVSLTITDAFGCVATMSDQVTVYPLPTASFTANNACQNSAVSFSSTSAPGVGTVSQTLWDVDNNGTTDYTSNSASHIYPQDGNHTMRLIVETNNGCRDTVQQNVTVYSLPVASFTSNPACQNQAVSFNSTSTVNNSTVTQTRWDVDNNGTIDYTSNPANHIYTQDGNHTVTLIVESAQGCRDTISQAVTVYPLPVASFTFVNACDNEAVTFNSTSTVSSGTISQTLWDVDNNGTTDYTSNPASHIYPQDGNHTIRLIVESNNGCRDTISQVITVYPLPAASFTFANACDNEAVTFNSTSTVSSGTVSQTLWDVDNNGTTDYTSNPASHIYPQDGNHTMRLIVETNNGCRDTVQQNVTVYSLPVASFTSNPACQNQAVSFNSTSTVNNSTVTQTRWDVDNNGTIDYTSNPANHIYTQDGNHTVTLIVESAQGCRDTISQAVTVYPLPVASFTFANACDNEAVTFNSTSTVSSGTISQTLWDVDNNGTTDYTSNPASHIYPQDGNHTIRLILESNNGCRDTISQVITVYPLPAASFTFANACDNEAVTFNSTSTVSSGTVSQTLWDVESDGATDYTTVSGNHIYPQDGFHAITLIVETNNGCRDTVRQMIEVYPLPIASFTANNACLNDVTNFQSTSTVTSGSITQTFWDVQNNNTVDYVGTSGSHTYPQDGTYSIQLITITNNGCGDTVVQNVIVYPLPVANFTTVNVCHQENVPFISSSSVSSGTIQQTLWDMESNGTTEYSSTSGNHMYPNAGTYLITLIVVSDMGCRDTISRNVQVYPLPIADFSVDKTVLTLDERVVTLNNTSTGEANWEWDLLGQLIVNESSIFYEFLDTGEFCFTLRVISDRGCEDVAERCVTVQPGFNFYIPNSFTPNEDKINQVFIPKGLGFVNFRMEIFTRWGDKIFETFDLKNGWTGIDNQGKDYPQGVYVYKIQVIDYKNQTHDYVGNVNLLR